MKTGIIIQVRMESTRFPGKTLKLLPHNGEPSWTVLAWVIEQCRRVGGTKTIVATSTNLADNAIAEFMANDYPRVPLFRGDPIDVLDRLYQCAKEHKLDEVVRITGDCPFACPETIKSVIALRRFTGCDYASNVDPPTWPDGLDCQCVTFEALDKAWHWATEPTDRDTVLQYIVHNRTEFSVTNLQCPYGDLSRYRCVLDTEDDYHRLSEMVVALDLAPGHVTVRKLLQMQFDRDAPDVRNERYLSSRASELANDIFTGSLIGLSNARRFQPYGASTYSKSYVAWGEGAPLYLTHAQGSRVWDVDGNEFIDMTAALGTTLLGHADSGVREAISQQMDLGIAFPLAHASEHLLAEKITEMFGLGRHGESKVVFGKNGSDVTSAAVRCARVATERQAIGVLHGAYHGWHDWAFAHTSRAFGCSENNVIRTTLEGLLTPNWIGWIKHLAAVIVEPDKLTVEQLRHLRKECTEFGTLLIFDEMVMAFHYRNGTLARTHGLSPDFVCLGKALGNGMPITCCIGKSWLMDGFVSDDHHRAPYAFYSGTHFGEACSMAAANVVCDRFDGGGQESICELQDVMRSGMIGLFPDHLEEQSGDIPRVVFKDQSLAATYRREMAHRGVLVYSMMMPTLSHSEADIERVLGAHNEVMERIIKKEARIVTTTGSSIMRS